MPALRLDGNILPEHMYSGELTKIIIPKYTGELSAMAANGEVRAPFQFSLPIMAAMYLDFCGDTEVCSKLRTKVGSSFCEVVSQGLVNGTPWRAIDPLYDNDHREPEQTPIRAIAYFSWEESSRIFLARRVFPSFFNFLSYSHCPERWGALGLTVLELIGKKKQYFTEHLPITELSDFNQAALPFLSEVERLHYESIFVIPVVKEWGTFNVTSALLGAFVVFVHKPEYLPSRMLNIERKLRFKDWLHSCVTLFAETLTKQHEVFFGNKPPRFLAEIWRERITIWRKEVRSREKKDIKASDQELWVYELTIRPLRCIPQLKFDEIVSAVIAGLGNIDFYAILDETVPLTNRAVLLVAPAKEVKERREDVRGTILRAVGAACHAPDKLAFQVKMRTL